tara:strand:- start:8035 stop:9873 length:1839 start_codon:yes stop_codon:yes gene_type:complete
MALRYWLEYDNPKGDLFRCEISRDDYTGDPIQIGGSCILDYAEVDSHYTVIRGSGLQINIEANPSLKFTDLYSGDITNNKVVWYKNGQIKFTGFLDPEGIFQDYVSDAWVITLDAVDGLGLLEDLAYVDANGLPYSGKQKDITFIVNCLRRTGILQNIQVSINTRYEGLAANLSPVANVYSNTERFYKDDGETISSCKDVLESVLGKYGAVICQSNGKWLIYCPSEMNINSQDRYIHEYSSTGAPLGSTSEYVFPVTTIGSQINGFELFHCNANQRIEIVPAAGAFKVNYKYGFLQNTLLNPNFDNDGVTLDGWDILQPSKVTLLEDRDPQPVFIDANIGTFQSDVLVNENTITISARDVVTVEIRAQSVGTTAVDGMSYSLRIIGDTETWYFDNGEWYNEVRKSRVFISTNEISTYKLETAPAPITGDVQLVFLLDNLRLHGASLSFTNQLNLKGEFHTSYSNFRKSKRVIDTVEIDVGDNVNDVFTGALYKADQNTNTYLWNNTVEENGLAPILKHMSQRILASRTANLSKFSGSVKGEILPLRLYEIDKVLSAFSETQLITYLPISITYDSVNDVSDVTFLEIIPYIDGFITDYEYAIDYGETVKPTII